MIEVLKLGIKYKNETKNVFSDLSFSLKSKEIISIVGPSGCGKTTLLNLIGGLLHEDEVIVLGEVKIKEKINIRYVFQDPFLLPWKNVTDNIRFSLEAQKKDNAESSKKISEILKLIGLGDCGGLYPKQLSRGMAQRVSFARALICEPDLLLMDEPFSSLDVGTKKRVKKIFLEIIKAKNISSIFVTHDLEEARAISDKIIAFPKDKIGNFNFVNYKDFGRAELESFF